MSPARNPESAFTLDDTISAPAPGQAAAPAAPKKRIRTTIAVPITEAGQLDMDRIRDPQAIERARAALGVVDPATIPPKEPPKINREFIKPAYSLLEVAIRFVGKKALKWPDALAVKMRFSEEKKDALVEPTAAVLARYAPAWLVANQDIAALGACLADAVDDMINRAITEYVAEMQAAAGAPPIITPATTPAQAPAPVRFVSPVPVGEPAAA
jgi:hypothetical protein